MVNLTLFSKRLLKNWHDDDASLWTAALSFYAVFSIVPLIFLLLSIGNLVMNNPSYEQSFFVFIQSVFGLEVSQTIRQAVSAVIISHENISLGLISVLSLAIGATGIFLQTHNALRHIWGLQITHANWWRFLKRRLLALFLLIPLALVLLITILTTTLVRAINTWLSLKILWLLPILSLADLSISVIVTTLITGLIYSIFAPKKYSRTILWLSSAFVALVFGIGRIIVNFYAANLSLVVAFGAAGSFLILLIWIYFSIHIFILGAEVAKTLQS